MLNIMLCCSAGMSTSLLVNKMRKEADTRGLDVNINAFGSAEFDNQIASYDVVLLGPQIKYMLNDLQRKAEPFNVKVQPIDMMDYGMQKADKVLDFAISLID